MATVMHSGTHFGGLLGGGGLAMVAAGCVFLQTQQAGPSWTMPMDPTAGSAHEALGAESRGDSALPQTITFSDFPDSRDSRLSLENEPDIIAASGPTTIAAPQGIEPARQPAPATVPPGVGDLVQPAAFIVKFKENDAIDEVIANWRRDRDAAEAAYAAWAEGDPLFSTMDVVGCSYSGELILEASVPAAPAAARARVSALVDLIRGHAAVAYADPDFTAQPGLSENE